MLTALRAGKVAAASGQPEWQTSCQKPERAAKKLLLMPNFQFLVSQYYVRFSFTTTAQVAFMFSTEGQFLIVCCGASATVYLHPPRLIRKCPTRLHMIGHPARTCTCDPSATSLPQSLRVLQSPGSLICLVLSRAAGSCVVDVPHCISPSSLRPYPPPCCQGEGWCVGGGVSGVYSRAHSRALSSNQDVVYQSLEAAPSVA